MSALVKHWTPDMPSLGTAVVAIGVFDGVHVGHQALLSAAVDEAARLHVKSVAVTFDRDPDQVVTPDSAAPQLLSLPAKCRFIIECGIDVVLVVPFDKAMASTTPEQFLDAVMGTCCLPASVHVGHDFRFGADAAGDIDTLYVWAAEHGAEVHPQPLVRSGGSPVTSTRIRALIAESRLAEATLLLGRPPRVVGTVHRGREQGRELGFPTANVVPMQFASLPPAGVYAGRAVLPDGSSYPAAISVGNPPTFPEARDYLEAHIIGYNGDLYDRVVTLEFAERLREQQAFGSIDALSQAIARDVEKVIELAANTPKPTVVDKFTYSDGETLDNGAPLIDDPERLAAAERAVAGIQAADAYGTSDEEWVPLTGPRHLSGVFADAGFTAALVTAPLKSAGIPHAWDPYPPEQMPGYRVGYGAVDRPFTLLVPKSRLAEARRVMGLDRLAPPQQQGLPIAPDRLGRPPVNHSSPDADDRPVPSEGSDFWRTIIWLLLGTAFIFWVLTSRGWGG